VLAIFFVGLSERQRPKFRVRASRAFLPAYCPDGPIVGLALAVPAAHGSTRAAAKNLSFRASCNELNRAVRYDNGRCGMRTGESKSSRRSKGYAIFTREYFAVCHRDGNGTAAYASSREGNVDRAKPFCSIVERESVCVVSAARQPNKATYHKVSLYHWFTKVALSNHANNFAQSAFLWCSGFPGGNLKDSAVLVAVGS
jgi:hypothetical protein